MDLIIYVSLMVLSQGWISKTNNQTFFQDTTTKQPTKLPPKIPQLLSQFILKVETKYQGYINYSVVIPSGSL